MDFFLKPLVNMFGVPKKGFGLRNQILEKFSCNSILVTADVSSLYTIIGHQDAISSVNWA